VLLNPGYSAFGAQLKEVQHAATLLGQTIRIVTASNEEELRLGFTTFAEAKTGAVISEPFFK
jgi:hypothetical protein